MDFFFQIFKVTVVILLVTVKLVHNRVELIDLLIYFFILF